jgi:hypothetical protein
MLSVDGNGCKHERFEGKGEFMLLLQEMLTCIACLDLHKPKPCNA